MKPCPTCAGSGTVPDEEEIQRQQRKDALAWAAMSESARERRHDVIVWRIVSEAAAKQFNTTVAEVVSRSRRRRAVLARQAAMWYMHQLGWSYKRIGRAVDRDHTTVIHGCNRIEKARQLRAIDIRLKGIAHISTPRIIASERKVVADAGS